MSAVAWRSKRLPPRGAADVVVLATRDQDLEAAAGRVAPAIRPRIVLHCAGSVGLDVLEPARRTGAHVGQLHPLVAVASLRGSACFAGAWALVAGERTARAAAHALVRLLGMRPLRAVALDRDLYHAAAVMTAAGAACLLDASSAALRAAGLPADQATAVLTPLLRSVAHNVDMLGLPAALTGPARRGDHQTMRRQAELVASRLPHLVGLVRELGLLQLRMARDAGERSPRGVDRLLRELGRSGGGPSAHAGARGGR